MLLESTEDRQYVCDNTPLLHYSGKKKTEGDRDIDEDISEIPVGGLLPFPIHVGKLNPILQNFHDELSQL